MESWPPGPVVPVHRPLGYDRRVRGDHRRHRPLFGDGFGGVEGPPAVGLDYHPGAEARLEALVTDVVWDRNDVAGVVLDGGEELRAPVVIGAGGVMSMVARKAGIRKKWSPEDVVSVCAIDYSASRERIDQVSYDSTFHAFFAPGIGGNYFFFMAEGVHVGGPGVTHSLISRAVKMRNNPARELLETVLDNPPTQRLLKAVDAVPREWQVHCLPWLDHMPTGTYTGGLMLVGDAAGLPEPMWAEGVWQAMYSGRLATEVAQEVIDEGNTSRASMERYHERLTDSPVGQEFIGAAQLRKLFEFLGDPVLFENLADLLVDFTVNLLMSGQEPKGEMFRRIFPILRDSRPTISTLTRLYLPVIARSELNAALEKLKELKIQVTGKRQEG